MKSTSHVYRIFGLIAVLALLGFCAQRLLRPEGFGEAGHYRLGSLFEIMEQEPEHQGETICGDCHDEIVEVHGKDIHYNVKCEDCHGSGRVHVRYNRGEDDEGITEAEAAMPREYTLEGCLFCHRRLVARPKTFPQIDHREHYDFLNVNDPETPCIECHSPHEPLYLLTDVSSARIHPIIFECRDCHEGVMEKDHREVPDHPVIFVCGDCHPAVVDAFKKKAHARIRCTACHLFHRENETAGRIFKNGNRRFCLLCHERKPFRDEGGPPLIDAWAHLEEEADIARSDEQAQDPLICIECHLQDIHGDD
ncbi:MAG: cytochrome c3 family protein [Planctomycetes bacterium]|nr:cytochrome c3 family protein [Planctomycetota bacterium]